MGRMGVKRRRVLSSLLLGVLVLACARDEDRSVEVSSDGTPVAIVQFSATPVSSAPIRSGTMTATPAPLPIESTPPPSLLDPQDLRGFTQPIEGSCFPTSDRLIPNAPREYRNGIHEGVDYYHLAVCVPISEGIPVLVMYGGVIIRADLAYEEITVEKIEELTLRTAKQGFSDEATLDIYRGRQVWIDHGNGVVTRYAHLKEIAQGIDSGVEVVQGQVLGTIGESGTPESVTAPGTEVHLHAEVRVGDSFLGAGLEVTEVKVLYDRLFGPEKVGGSAE
jgi:murein DD-endopeptidase MepM/ murein hydrolase activator NlpD